MGREEENRVEACQSKLPRSRGRGRRKSRKRVGSGVFMGNDREWEAECAGGAWAGHSGDRVFWAGMVVHLSVDESPQRLSEQ
jgi:hypothetical protein